MSWKGPLEDSYWAAPGELLAGPYPLLDAPDRETQRARVRALLEAGVRTVIDLRTPVEPPGIRVLLGKLSDEAAWMGVPILDGAAPTPAEARLVLDAIDASIARGYPVYVHCMGGRGRTGTIVALWWMRHGRSAEDALAELGRRREGLLHGARPSPETPAQMRLIRTFSDCR